MMGEGGGTSRGRKGWRIIPGESGRLSGSLAPDPADLLFGAERFYEFKSPERSFRPRRGLPHRRSAATRSYSPQAISTNSRGDLTPERKKSAINHL